MKAVRLSSVVLAFVLVVLAFSPAAAKPSVAQPGATTLMVTSPLQPFLNAANGLALLEPMNASAPLVTVSVESAAATDYACTLVSQSPKDYTKMKSRQYFDASWVVQNSGRRIWYANAVSFKYIGGTKMQTHGNVFGIPEDIGRLKKLTLTVDMTAPKALGGYSTLWGLFTGKQAFCKVTMTIAVTR
jgi:hypothetical protein